MKKEKRKGVGGEKEGIRKEGNRRGEGGEEEGRRKGRGR